jgi:hypothetical protein
MIATRREFIAAASAFASADLRELRTFRPVPLVL